MELKELDRLPARNVPAHGPARPIAEPGAVGGLDRGVLRGAREHFLHDVPQPGPTLRRDARAALIGIAAADALALAICVAAPAPQAQPFVGFAQNCRKLFRQLVLLARSSRHCTHFTGPRLDSAASFRAAGKARKPGIHTHSP